MSVSEKGARWTRSARVMIATAFRADPWRATTVFALSIVTALTSVLFGVWLKLLVDAATHRDLARVLFVAVGAGISFAVQTLASISGIYLRIGLQERAGLLIDRRIIEVTAGLPGIEHHERPEYLDEIELLRAQREMISNSVGALVENVAILAQLSGTALLLARLHPVLLALPLFALPSLWTGTRGQRLLIAADERTAEPRRQSKHFFDLATTAAPGKELRIFGLGDELIRRHEGLLRDNDRVMNRARLHGAILYAAGWVVFAIGYVGALVFVVTRAVHHQATLGDVVLAMTLAEQVNNQVSGVAQMFQWLLSTLKVVGRFLWLVDYAAGRHVVSLDRVDVPDRIARGIDIEAVSFRYPGTETDVLSGATLHIPAGSTVAIVGDNGAGKSTLVKLLCRFYELDAGRVAVDGIDIRRFDVEEWRARMSAGFQDFARFEFLAREAVGVGRVVAIDDAEAVNEALARASASDVIDGLARGLETQLGKSFDDGVELSGGQWQKLALGRAMMREAPLLLVLDEPTAALDAQTEHALFERYAGAARRVAAETGAITVFVSHRFSTVRMADLIVVVDGGRIVEAGSHAELVARAGLYAELYELQARAYR